MAIKKISEEQLYKIKRKSAQALPNKPSAQGYTAEEIKNYLTDFVTGDNDSFLTELHRMVDEINSEFGSNKEETQKIAINTVVEKFLKNDPILNLEFSEGKLKATKYNIENNFELDVSRSDTAFLLEAEIKNKSGKTIYPKTSIDNLIDTLDGKTPREFLESLKNSVDYNSSNIETISARIETLINSAPEALDTLKELANALGNDENFAATITAELGKKVNTSLVEELYVKKSTTINGKDLSQNINLTAKDIENVYSVEESNEAISNYHVLNEDESNPIKVYELPYGIYFVQTGCYLCFSKSSSVHIATSNCFFIKTTSYQVMGTSTTNWYDLIGAVSIASTSVYNGSGFSKISICINNGTINSTPIEKNFYVTLNNGKNYSPSFYAPYDCGVSGQILQSNGENKVPSWIDNTYLSYVVQELSDEQKTQGRVNLNAEETGIAKSLIEEHNTNEETHSDIRELIKEIRNKIDGINEAISFVNETQLSDWISGTYSRSDGKTVNDLFVGQHIYIQDQSERDFWVSQLPISSINDLTELPTDKIELEDYVLKENLAKVATSGSYKDLLDLPNIYYNLSEMIEDDEHKTITKQKLELIETNAKQLLEKLDKNLGIDEANKMLITDSNGTIVTAIAGSMATLIDNLESTSTTSAPTANQVRILNNIKLNKQQGVENVNKYLYVNEEGLVDLTNINLANYLPLAGGTMEGPLVITGGDAISGVGNMQLDTNGQITAKGSTSTLFGRTNSGADLCVGHSSHNLIIRGAQTRPTYNGSSMALSSDIPTVPTVNNATISLTCGIRVVGSYTTNQASNVSLDFAALFLNVIYPVGSIYMSINNASPASFLGGSWTQIEAGYALWTASSGAGGTIGAGLPNITGDFGAKTYDADTDGTGAFRWSWTDSKVTPSGTNKDKNTRVQFNASRSSSIYGSSTTVQPPAYKVYAWRRTA